MGGFITSVSAKEISEFNSSSDSIVSLYVPSHVDYNVSGDVEAYNEGVKSSTKYVINKTKVNTKKSSKSNTNVNRKKLFKSKTLNPKDDAVWISRMHIKKNVVIISLKSNKKGIIYYTTDGSKPTNRSKKYKSPIKLSSKQILKYAVVNKRGALSKIFKYKRFLGKTSKGYVEKLYYGNLSSTKTMVLIVGVHVQESGMHEAIQHSLKIKSSVLKRRFVLYYIHVNKDKSNYAKSRMNGQILAKKFIVPDISYEKPEIATDIHETRYKISGYKYPRFIHILSTNKRPGVKVSKKLYKKSVVYLKRIIKIDSYLKRYDPPPTGSSPPYLTVPIANKGFVSYVYETEASYSVKAKQKYAKKYILALDDFNLSFK
jgi:hypothetical protein